MIRSVKFSLNHLTHKKRAAINAMLRERRAAINFFCKKYWKEKGKLNKECYNSYAAGSLAAGQKSDALHQALTIIIATKKATKATGNKCSSPHFNGACSLRTASCYITKYRKGGFDYCVSLYWIKGSPIIVPLKSYRRFNYWLSKPGAKLTKSCLVDENNIWLSVEIPDLPTKEDSHIVGIDIGYKKLITCSTGETIGKDIANICASVRRKKPGSKGKKRAQATRKDYINRSVKQLPWDSVSTIAIEDLTGLKLETFKKGGGKSSRRSRKAMAPWTYRQAVSQIELLAAENRVRLHYVDPRNTSRACPSCGWVAKENRVAENFKCVRCNYSTDADLVGAMNVLAKATGNYRESSVPDSPSIGQNKPRDGRQSGA